MAELLTKRPNKRAFNLAEGLWYLYKKGEFAWCMQNTFDAFEDHYEALPLPKWTARGWVAKESQIRAAIVFSTNNKDAAHKVLNVRFLD